jgi:hypothetical protein
LILKIRFKIQSAMPAPLETLIDDTLCVILAYLSADARRGLALLASCSRALQSQVANEVVARSLVMGTWSRIDDRAWEEEWPSMDSWWALYRVLQFWGPLEGFYSCANAYPWGALILFRFRGGVFIGEVIKPNDTDNDQRFEVVRVSFNSLGESVVTFPSDGSSNGEDGNDEGGDGSGGGGDNPLAASAAVIEDEGSGGESPVPDVVANVKDKVGRRRRRRRLHGEVEVDGFYPAPRSLPNDWSLGQPLHPIAAAQFESSPTSLGAVTVRLGDVVKGASGQKNNSNNNRGGGGVGGGGGGGGGGGDGDDDGNGDTAAAGGGGGGGGALSFLHRAAVSVLQVAAAAVTNRASLLSSSSSSSSFGVDPTMEEAVTRAWSIEVPQGNGTEMFLALLR